jgi:hypothetical protein
MLAYYELVQFTRLVEDLRVSPERMLRNLDASFGLVFSQPVLLALVEARPTRDEAYRIVQRNAMRAWNEERSFRELLADDPDVAAALSDAAARRVLRPEAFAGERESRLRCARRNWRSVNETALPHLYTGKVRELYEVGMDALLMVASDRVSVFDVVLPDEIPDKGRVLTALSHFWFDQTRAIASNHVLSCDPTDFPRDGGRGRGSCHVGQGDAAGAARVRGARLPLRRRLGRVQRGGHGWRLRGTRRVATGGTTPGAVVHAVDEGRVRPRCSGGSRRSARARGCRPVRGNCATCRCACTRSARNTRVNAVSSSPIRSFEFGERDGELLVIDEMMTPTRRVTGLPTGTSRERRRDRSTSSTCATS